MPVPRSRIPAFRGGGFYMSQARSPLLTYARLLLRHYSSKENHIIDWGDGDPIDVGSSRALKTRPKRQSSPASRNHLLQPKLRRSPSRVAKQVPSENELNAVLGFVAHASGPLVWQQEQKRNGTDYPWVDIDDSMIRYASTQPSEMQSMASQEVKSPQDAFVPSNLRTNLNQNKKREDFFTGNHSEAVEASSNALQGVRAEIDRPPLLEPCSPPMRDIKRRDQNQTDIQRMLSDPNSGLPSMILTLLHEIRTLQQTMQQQQPSVHRSLVRAGSLQRVQASARSLYLKARAMISQLSPKKLLRGLRQYMLNASESHLSTAKSWGDNMRVMFWATFAIGSFHALSPYVKAWSFPLFSSVDETFGFLIHTASMPFLIAMSPGLKKAFRAARKNPTFASLFPSKSRRAFTQSRQIQGIRKETSYRDLRENHQDLMDKEFPMAAVLDDLRNLQALRGSQASRDYKVAERRLFRVQHEAEEGGKALTVRQVTELLQPDDSVGWTVIRQRLLFDRVDAIDNLSKEDRAKVLFQRVYGVGSCKAEKFVQAGYLTLDQLREAPLEKAQRIGLEHMDDIECLIPRAESEEWKKRLLQVFHSVDPKLGADLLGSFRRGDYFSSDLDWVIYHPDVVEMRVPRNDSSGRMMPNPRAEELLDATIAKLREENLLADDLLAHGPLAAKGLVRLSTEKKARRIDFNFAPYERRAFYTLAKTGDTDLMVHLRGKAKARGLALNEYGIGPHNENGSAWTKSLLNATEEKQIFDFLKVPYLEPEERNIAQYRSKLKIFRD